MPCKNIDPCENYTILNEKFFSFFCDKGNVDAKCLNINFFTPCWHNLVSEQAQKIAGFFGNLCHKLNFFAAIKS
jgi:hypothetical protein